MTANQALRFVRRFIVPDLLLLLVELLVVAWPLWDCFNLDENERRLFWQLAPAAVILAQGSWMLAMRAWRYPIASAAKRRIAGEVLDAEARAEAWRAILDLPRRALLLRVLLWCAGGFSIALALRLRGRFPTESVLTVTAICASHATGVSVFRALWYERLLERVRAALLPDLDLVRRFAETYKQKIVLAALAAGALGVLAIGTFTWFFIPINLEHYLRLETYFPLTIVTITVLWYLWMRRLPEPIERYLAAATSTNPSEQPTRDDPRALAAYACAQSLPYKLAVSKFVTWAFAEAALVVQSVLWFSVDPENAAMMGGNALMVTVGVALYEGLWQRVTMRPLLTHIAARHRPPPDSVRTPLSLRSKMFAGFGALTLFACGLSLFWSFMQYKTLATVFIQREADLRLDALVGDLCSDPAKLDNARIQAGLEATANQFAPPESVHDHAVLYWLPADAASAISVGGDKKKGPPPLPWAGAQLMRRLERGHMELSSLTLTGSYARLCPKGRDLGSIALLLPGYRGRGPSTVPQIRVLISFFFILLCASMGVVILISTDLTGPIRELERRADAMAKGDLTRPVVTASGEGDEVGRLTFAFEEMRRALNDKLRSSTEINLSLEQEVSRRTAELERRNRELADALEQLKRAQAELIRSEKMASMGRLVAGIAHEINNPVNAVVNTVGPLEELLARLKEHGAPASEIEEVKEMIRVIQRGARRTKEIVQALHNYSRGDDDRVVEVDLQRSIDESLDLLRHHLKNGIKVERDYGEVGRVRGRTALNQVFMNLLSNAAQALGQKLEKTGAGGTIRIKTARADGNVIVTVADDGPGIPPEVLPRIFDPFFTTKDVGQGSGLGLSIVHGIVERHGGTIAVASEVGKGTTFTITLPAEQREPPHSASAPN